MQAEMAPNGWQKITDYKYFRHTYGLIYEIFNFIFWNIYIVGFCPTASAFRTGRAGGMYHRHDIMYEIHEGSFNLFTHH